MSSIEGPSLVERVATAEAVAYGQQGYLTDEGEYDLPAISDVIYELVVQAVASKKNERAKVCVSRREIMDKVFPKVAGPEGWADEDDPDVAEGVYKRLDSACWRMTAMTPNGTIQQRLNSDHALVLCRTRVNPHRTEAVYTTRDLACLLEDAIKPQRANQKARADRDAAFTAMLIERVSEHGKRFNRELIGGLTTGLNSAKAITAGALQATLVDDIDDDE